MQRTSSSDDPLALRLRNAMRDLAGYMKQELGTAYSTGSVFGAKRLCRLAKKGYSLERLIMVEDSPEKHPKNYGIRSVYSRFKAIPRTENLSSFRSI